MKQIDVSSEWQKLCFEYESASDKCFYAFSVVNKKFETNSSDSTSTNSMDKELWEFEKTWQDLEDVKKRMDIFVKQYA